MLCLLRLLAICAPSRFLGPFAKKTGFRSELIWNSERAEKEFMEEAEEFETGIFE
jgi:hypothetical protein